VKKGLVLMAMELRCVRYASSHTSCVVRVHVSAWAREGERAHYVSVIFEASFQLLQMRVTSVTRSQRCTTILKNKPSVYYLQIRVAAIFLVVPDKQLVQTGTIFFQEFFSLGFGLRKLLG